MRSLFTLLIQPMKVGFVMAYVEMSSHVLRSVLSIMGVMLGIASLVIMVTMVGGVDVYLNQKMAQWAGSVWFWQKPMNTKTIAASRSPGLRYSDGLHLEQDSVTTDFFYKIIERSGSGTVKNVRVDADLQGIDLRTLSSYQQETTIDKGNWFEPKAFSDGLPHCIISWHIAQTIEGQIQHNKKAAFQLIGSDFVFNDHVRLTIVGIYKPRDPSDQLYYLQNCVFLPLKSMQKYVTGFDPKPYTLRIGVKDLKNLEKVTSKLSTQLQLHHRGVQDFEYHFAEWLEQITAMLTNASLLMLVISIVSLSVGGLSIMNVMLSSIAERIYEIGVRKALGANSMQIFIQLLVETTTLSLTGGIFGIIVGMIPLFFKDVIKKSTQGVIEPTLVMSHIIAICILTVLVGIVFGLYPAIKAGRLNPIEALRYDG